MIKQYIGLSEVNGSLVALEGVSDCFNEELVELRLSSGEKRVGRIVKIEGDKAFIQVFEGTKEISVSNAMTELKGRPMELALSPEIVGRVFDGMGRPKDGLGDVYPVKKADINGSPINPVKRVYPETTFIRAYHP